MSKPFTKNTSNEIDGYIIMGQSNCVGTTGSLSNSANLTRRENDGFIPLMNLSGTLGNGLPDPATATWGNNSAVSGVDNVGPERGFLRQLFELGHQNICGLKYAVNGRGINYFTEQSGVEDLDVLIPRAESQSTGPISWKSVIWVQGQSDSGSQGSVDAYASSLDALMQAMRVRTKNPGLKLCIPAHPPSWMTTSHSAELRAVVEAYALAHPEFCAPAVDLSDTTTRDGGTHYTHEDFEVIGSRLARAYVTHFGL